MSDPFYMFINVLAFWTLTEYYRQNGIFAHHVGVKPLIDRPYM